MPSNLERLNKLAEDTFAIKSDPRQLNVNQKVIERLKQIHPSTIAEYDEGEGPVAWLLVIPTTTELMQKFISDEITEKELFELTPTDGTYDALYLCSALVLEEYRRKGIVKELALKAINDIRNDHPINSLFVWAFSPEGNSAAENIAITLGLPLFKKPED
jgi:hypothetical protein